MENYLQTHFLIIFLFFVRGNTVGIGVVDGKGVSMELNRGGRKKRKEKQILSGKRENYLKKDETVKGNTIIYMFVCKCGISVENAGVSTFSSPYILAEFPFFSHYVGIHFHSYSFIRSFSM